MIEVVIAPDDKRDEIWQLFLEYADELKEYDGEPRPHFRHHYPYFDRFWGNDKRTPFLILYDHEPIGFCFIEDTGVSYKINDFYVRQLHRRRGFGRMAVERVKEHCRLRGKHKTITANIYVSNTCAVSFWQSASFKDTGRRTRIGRLRLIETEADLLDGSE